MNKTTLVLLMLGVVLTGCTTPKQVPAHSASVATADAVIPNEPRERSFAHLPEGQHYLVSSGGVTVEVKKGDVLSILNELPMNIRMRHVLAAVTQEERDKEYGEPGRATPEEYGANPQWVVRYFQASDGIEFLVDQKDLALWIRKDRGAWICVVSQVYIYKTHGGLPPWLPVLYAGNKRFLVAVTVPGKATPDGHFNRALCATFLIDSENGSLTARSEPVVYEGNPGLVFPKSWPDQYGIEFKEVAPLAK